MSLLLLLTNNNQITLTTGPSVQVLLETVQGQFVDVTDAFRTGSDARGKSKELDQNAAGKIQLEFSNADRRFDPTYASGPYYGNLKPMRKIIVIAAIAGVAYAQFFGFVDGWVQNRNGPYESTATVTATDGFKVLNKKKLPSSAYLAEVQTDAPVSLWKLNETATATTIYDSAGTKNLAPYGAPTLGGPGLISHEPGGSMTLATNTVGASATGPFPITGNPMSMELVYRKDLAGTGGILAGVFDPGGSSMAYLGVFSGGSHEAFVFITGPFGSQTVSGVAAVGDGLTHHLAFTWGSDNTVRLYVDGVLDASAALTAGAWTTTTGLTFIGSAALGSVLGDSPEGNYQMVAFYNKVLTPARIAAHSDAVYTPWDGDSPGQRMNRILDIAMWPADLRDLDSGTGVI